MEKKTPRKKLTNGLEIAKQYAISKGGYCHSSEYINCETKLEWSCGNNEHRKWYATYSKVVNGKQWCPQCAKERNAKNQINKNALNLAKKHAESKDGECLSTEYINNSTKLIWKCNNKNHSSWFASYGNVVSTGTWCPECGNNRNVQENRVRNILNLLFNTNFIKNKPKWNINPETNRELELDGYSETLKIAFEYQGEYHFYISNFNTQDDLDYIKRKDAYKKENCDKNGVSFIVINFIKNGNCFNSFMKEINRAIIEANLKYDNKYELNELKKLFNTTTASNIQKENFLNAKNYAKSKNGTCLSNNYINARTNMEWKCNVPNHPSWFSSYNSIVDNETWCSKCGDEQSSIKQRNSNGLKKAQEYAQSKNGKCLSRQYFNNKTDLKWKCDNPTHLSWQAPFYRVVGAGRWCPACANNQKLDGLTIAKKHAESKNGQCLSKEYINSKTKIEWACHNNNHKSWFSPFEKVVRRNQWCPECYKESRKKN